MPASVVPSDTERKNSATIWVWNAFGASLVVTDSPIGERNSSARVNRNRMPTRASSGVLPPPASGMKARNARPMTNRPMANFSGELGCLRPSRVHRAAITPAKMMMNTGLMDWTQARRHFPAEEVPVQLLLRVHGDER